MRIEIEQEELDTIRELLTREERNLINRIDDLELALEPAAPEGMRNYLAGLYEKLGKVQQAQMMLL